MMIETLVLNFHQPASSTVGGINHLAYVDFAVTRPVTLRGILKYSKLLASAKELGGIKIGSRHLQ